MSHKINDLHNMATLICGCFMARERTSATAFKVRKIKTKGNNKKKGRLKIKKKSQVLSRDVKLHHSFTFLIDKARDGNSLSERPSVLKG